MKDFSFFSFSFFGFGITLNVHERKRNWVEFMNKATSITLNGPSSILGFQSHCDKVAQIALRLYLICIGILKDSVGTCFGARSEVGL